MSLVSRSAILLTAFLFVSGASANEDGFANGEKWVATWGAAAQPDEAGTPALTLRDLFPMPEAFSGQTVRQIVRTSIDGRMIRVRLSNLAGEKTVIIDAASIGRHRANGQVVDGSLRALTFNGDTTARIPVGGFVTSDPLDLRVGPNRDLAISLYLGADTPVDTVHADANATTYVSELGDHTMAVDFPTAETNNAWFWVAGVDVIASADTQMVVALGDSITDGFLSEVDGNNQWPAELARQLNRRRGDKPDVAVVNMGIGGNKVLYFDIFGQNALARMERDVISQPGATHLILLMGINDIILPVVLQDETIVVTTDEIIAGYVQIANRARSAGLKVYIGTLTPFDGSDAFTPEGEQLRLAVNEWIRNNDVFDGVIDFDAVIRDADNPQRMSAEFDSGDALHPSDAGLAAMARSIDLSIFDPAH